MRIATYNANSIRSRIEPISRWLAMHQPDVLALQETKVQDSEFPIAELAATGYKVCMRGQLRNNGVAILSRREPDSVLLRLAGDPLDEARFMQAVFGPVTIINSYVPQGYEVGSDRFRYKLDWFRLLREHLERSCSPTQPIVWVGDFNAALTDIDVHNPKRLWGSVCYCQPVKDALLNVMEWGFVDLFRAFHPEPEHYTFWDYRIFNALKNNIGWRLDYIMATASAAAACTDCRIDPEPRGWDKPSDHTFIWADFDDGKMTHSA
ncbi:MAG: exodeoxyribonuclease III [Planctomycetaceae bacterium]|nr:exodeoxyribonuclease III [Planctomycetaceae bacterium]